MSFAAMQTTRNVKNCAYISLLYIVSVKRIPIYMRYHGVSLFTDMHAAPPLYLLGNKPCFEKRWLTIVQEIQ